jgi:hypothetical protein
MSTQRKLVRHAVRDVLNVVPSLSGRVKASRVYPVTAKNLPIVLVYTERDPATKSNDFMQKRDLQLKIVVIVQADADADDALDDLCEVIEMQIDAHMDGAMVPSSPLASLVDSVQYIDTVLTYQGEDGRGDFVHAEMQYTVSYFHEPAQEFDELGQVSVTFDMANPRNAPPDPHTPDGQIDARADIAFPIDP